MKYSFVVTVVVFVQACCCAGLGAGASNEIREVVIGSGGDPVADQPEYATYWSKAQSILVEKQFGITSKTSTEEEITAWPLRWIEFLDGSWLNEILVQCERDPVFKAGVTQNLSAMQAVRTLSAKTPFKLIVSLQFVAFVSIGYAVIAMWLGPIKLTCWQQRTVLVTYSAAGTVQAIFLLHAFRFLDIHYAYPSTLALAIVFFVAFNLTNALLVLEADDPEAAVQIPVQQIVEASSTRVITAQRAACC